MSKGLVWESVGGWKQLREVWEICVGSKKERMTASYDHKINFDEIPLGDELESLVFVE